jgi:16S rRNA (cytosine967-C5)-methyltransferase
MRFEDSITAAMRLMPRHRVRTSRRASSIGLDDLIDEARERDDLDAGTLDLLLMGYRYRPRALAYLKKFLKGRAPKPLELEDLLVLCFASLLSRDKMSPALQVNSFVEVAARCFSPHLKGVVNAFARQVLRDAQQIEDDRKTHAELWLPQSLAERWRANPELLQEAARRLVQRPSAGVWALNENLNFEKKPLQELRDQGSFQAMDPGSWALVTWIDATLGAQSTETLLDACAAPGGKFVALTLLRQPHGLKKSVATDAKFPRLERLKHNLTHWSSKLKPNIVAQTFAWGEDEIPAAWRSQRWDLVLADLPCTGSGTFHTRPDLLDRDPFERLESLRQIQEAILRALQELQFRDLFVSICSCDPEEVRSISQILKVEPRFCSWDPASENPAVSDECEGLTGWHLRKN